MITLHGRVTERGYGHMAKRMNDYPEVFRNATGELLIAGTVNIDVGTPVPPREHFRILAKDINEPIPQDLLFEVCRVNGIWAYRVRPLDLRNGSGGHGDHILELSSSQKLPNQPGSQVEVAFFR
jgi:hypothetical protein